MFNPYFPFSMRKFLSLVFAIAIGVLSLSSCEKATPDTKESNQHGEAPITEEDISWEYVEVGFYWPVEFLC